MSMVLPSNTDVSCFISLCICNIRGVRIGTAGMAVPGPIFQRVQSKFSALHVHTIIIFSASHDLSGARNGIIDSGYTSASHHSIVPNEFHPPKYSYF